ncbi:universal stress protein [Ekhidna sp.]|uniref:universal stress protein n=1 Tax=Ekhidna sp. TaxID=2608089 RepID=UPI0032980CE5
MKKILVPIDFSDRSSDALDFAIEFCEHIKGELTLLHVLDFPSTSFNSAGEWNLDFAQSLYEEEFIKRVHSQLEEWGDRVMRRNPEIPLTTKMEYGSTYHSVSKEITEEKANWIVMGSTGSSGIEEIFIGSLAERVIRHADCPVFTIKGPTKISNMKSMVFASDLSNEQDIIAYKAKDVQELFKLNMHVIRVKTPHNFLTEEVAQQQLKDFAKRNYLKDYTLNTIEADYSDIGISKFADDIDAGLIVMGTHGKTGLAHIFGGSRAEDLANRAHVPVLTFKIPFD